MDLIRSGDRWHLRFHLRSCKHANCTTAATWQWASGLTPLQVWEGTAATNVRACMVCTPLGVLPHRLLPRRVVGGWQARCGCGEVLGVFPSRLDGMKAWVTHRDQ